MRKKNNFENIEIDAYWLMRVKQRGMDDYKELKKKMKDYSKKHSIKIWAIVLNAMREYVENNIAKKIPVGGAEKTFYFCREKITQYAKSKGIFVSQLLKDAVIEFLNKKDER